MMLLTSFLNSESLEFIKSNLIIIKTNTLITNRGIFLFEIATPEALYRMKRYDVLVDYVPLFKQSLNVSDKIIEVKELIITNIKTEIVTIKELDKIQKKKVILITAGVSVGVTTVLAILVNILISSIK